MPLLALPEEVIVHVLSFLRPHTIITVGAVCKRLYSICHFRLVWKTAWQSSDLPLIEPQSTEDEGDVGFDYKSLLIRAILLKDNWTSTRPTPKSTRLHSSAVSAVWMLKSRYLLIIGGSKLSCWDLDGEDKRLWEYRLMPGAGWTELLETASVRGSEPRFLFGYTTMNDPNSCHILMSGEISTSPPQTLCNIDTHAAIHSFGLSESKAVLVCVDGSMVVAGLQSPLQQDTLLLRRDTRQHARSVHQVIVLDDLVLLVRGQNRGVAIDAYELCNATEMSTYIEARNSTSVSIAQAQLVAISPPRPLRSASTSEDDGNSLHFNILAALPYSVDHYSLSMHRSTGDMPLSSALELMGDDQTSRRPSFGRVIAEPDGYDSDSRPSRIAQPNQVLDLQLGRTSRRAVTIQISAHTNDRTIWGYSIPKGVGALTARRLAFSAPGRMMGSPSRSSDINPLDVEIITMLRSHACRIVFDEATGRTVVVADSIGYWTFGVGATYGTFAYLNQHYNSERHFQRIRNHIRTFANKTIKPKWKTITDVEKSLPEGDDEAYRPPVVRLVEKKREQVSSSTWGFPDGLNFLKSPLSWGLLSDSMTSWEWPASLANLQTQMSALILELGRGEGSLWSQIVKEAPNSELHPEIEWDAEVRIGDELCFREKAFLRERKRRMLQAYAKLFDVSPSELDERDLPIVAIAASGGGFRAMCNTAGALRRASSSGILDVTTYISAISGSTWTLGALYSGVAGSFDPHAAAQHIQLRAQIPQLDPKILDMLITPPTNKYLLAGLIQKAVAPQGSLSLVDIYGTLISARLFCPSEVSALDPTHLSLSHFRRPVDDGSLPMPIFTAISRHVSPAEQAISSQQDMVVDKARVDTLQQEKLAVAHTESQWLWYEFSPYEVGCDEIGAWIPSWAFGREFYKGKSIDRAPEVSFSILAGIYASAFCASLQLYYQEVKPTIALLPNAMYSWIDGIMNEREQDLDVVHPVPPNKLPNFAKGLSGRLREGSPRGFEDQDFIPLMDAGAELNIPYYPLLRRDVDCIIALDASADGQELWFTRAETYAMRKGLQLWPRGVKWPKEILRPEPAATPTNSAAENVASEAEMDVATQAQKQQESDSKSVPEDPVEPRATRSPSLTEMEDSDSSSSSPPTAFVWIGSSKSDESSAATPIEKFDEEALAERDGIGIVYMPILANEQAVPGMDPYEISTWRTELSMEESDKLMRLAETNFMAGEDKIKAILKAMWLRKKRARKEAERSHWLKRLHHPP